MIALHGDNMQWNTANSAVANKSNWVSHTTANDATVRRYPYLTVRLCRMLFTRLRNLLVLLWLCLGKLKGLGWIVHHWTHHFGWQLYSKRDRKKQRQLDTVLSRRIKVGSMNSTQLIWTTLAACGTHLVSDDVAWFACQQNRWVR